MKRKFLSALSSGLLLSVVSISLSACNTSAVDNSKLVIGLECAYQPFNWTLNASNEHTLPIDGTNEFADGYDISIAKYLSKDLNKEVVIKRIEWDSLIPSLNNGEINMILAGMSSTAERRENIDFTDPYLSSELAFLMNKEFIPSGNSLVNPLSYNDTLALFTGKSLICQMGVAGDDIISNYFANKTEYNIRHNNALKTYPLAAEDVARGVSFAMPAELPVVEAMTNINSNLGVLYVDKSFLSEGDLEGLKVNIGIKKGNSELLSELNASLGRLSLEERNKMMGDASTRSASIND